MKQATVRKIVAFGTMTGIRSMAGVATLALGAEGPARAIVPSLAAGEMIADKTPFVGDRVDALPLAGRAVLGALCGGLIARDERDGIVLGGLLGAASAIVATHLAYQARQRLTESSVAGGLIEDALLLTIAAQYAVSAGSMEGIEPSTIPSARRPGFR